MARKKHYVDQNVYELALERIRHAYDTFDHIAVAFSGGKDSTVCLNLTLQVAKERNRLPLDVVHFDVEVVSPPTVAYIERVAQMPDVHFRWYCLEHRARNFCSRKHPYWYTWDSENKPLWVRDLPSSALTHLPGYQRGLSVNDCNGLLFDPKTQGTVGFILGIRTDESLQRFRSMTQKKSENYITHYDGPTNPGGIYKVHPIYDWTFHDVWTAPKRFGWDVNQHYDALEQAGVPRQDQRVHIPFGEMGSNVFWSYRTCFPNLWEKMLKRVPGVNTAYRYFDTELYGWGSVPPKPANLTHEEYVLHLIRQHHPSLQSTIAKRIQQEIDRHYKKTRDPIVYDAIHPISGLHWKYLYKIAMRGDIAGRRHTPFLTPTEKQWKRYHEARRKEERT